MSARRPWIVLPLMVLALRGGASADVARLPDTHAGRCAAAYFKAFNSGDEAEVQRFEQAYRSAAALASRPMDERLRMYHELRQRWETLTVTRVLRSADHDISVSVSPSIGKDELTFDFEFEPQPPHGLTAIKIAQRLSPADAEAAARLLTPELRSAAVSALADALSGMYVYPEVGEKMAAALREHSRAGRYDSGATARELAEALTRDAQAICHDKHLRVRASAPPPDGADSQPHDADRRLIREDRRENYGFERVEVLPGNIGYLKFNLFHPSAEAQESAAAALGFLANSEALIFDLRENGGGSPEMIRFISSYLFDKPTHLNSFYDRLRNKTSETWTTERVPGRRFPGDLPVYVLTSGRTFSGAEEFTYNLKCLKRATIVGETTGGGAHLVRLQRLSDCLVVTMPYARAENPITKTNWEGVGVTPDIETFAGAALDAALRDARARLARRGS